MSEQPLEGERLQAALECLLFVAGEPLTLQDLVKVTGSDADTIRQILFELQAGYGQRASGLHLIEIAEGWQMATRSEYAAIVGKLLAPNANRLSRPALETVTIIAYRQPCTQAEVEAIRGVSVDGVLKTLVERDLIREAGRKATPGRPILYETTSLFLHYFGLSSLQDLPKLEEEDSEETARAAQTALHAAGMD